MHKKRRFAVQLCAMLFLLVCVLTLPLCFADVERIEYTYVIDTGDEPIFIHDKPQTAAHYSGLRISPSQGADAQFVLDKGETVTVTHDGETVEMETRCETVANLLRRANIPVTSSDMIVLNVTGAVPSISVQTQIQYSRTKTLPASYQTKRVANPLLAKGTERVVQKGKAGTITQTYTETYLAHGLFSTEVTKETTNGAVDEIIEYGTCVTSVSNGDTLVSATPNKDGNGGYLTFASGDTVAYSSVRTCEATAYCGGVCTASGASVGPGTVAVDTSTFPFGTRFYIRSSDGSWTYGMGTAKDRGSAIKGNIIDLWFDSYHTACQWGRRNCTVYVLG